jgi:hypothetical protein
MSKKTGDIDMENPQKIKRSSLYVFVLMELNETVF